MLAFFRQIRRRLMDGNKTSRYLLYAIGEILLVVMGILIALQVNNWNEWRKDRKEELVILNGLHKEFLMNQKQVADRKERLEIGIEMNTQLISLLMSASYTADDVMNYVQEFNYGYASGRGTTNLPSGVIDALLSSDHINLIRNDSLKYLLTNWKGLSADFMENELFQLEFNLKQFDPLINEMVPIAEFQDIPDEESREKHLRLASDLSFRNYVITNKSWLSNHVLPKCVEVEEMIENIISLIESEFRN